MAFYITCVDNCLYQEDGLCTLTQITSSNGQATNTCPYFRNVERNYSKTYENKINSKL